MVLISKLLRRFSLTIINHFNITCLCVLHVLSNGQMLPKLPEMNFIQSFLSKTMRKLMGLESKMIIVLFFRRMDKPYFKYLKINLLYILQKFRYSFPTLGMYLSSSKENHSFSIVKPKTKKLCKNAN